MADVGSMDGEALSVFRSFASQPDGTVVVFVLGGPGAGKGTQCTRLVRNFGFVHLSAGDLLREERLRPGSQYGDLINNYIRDGKIVPSHITIGLLYNAMEAAHKGASKTSRFLIDGFPRALEQAVLFEEHICKPKHVLFLKCSEKVMFERLLKRADTSGRVDDNLESIKKRFLTFQETSYPVVEHYRLEKDMVTTVNCEREVDPIYVDVKAAILKILEEKEPQVMDAL
ncbi:hypothetical protein SeMB42_g05601 [Synchytrium endobioticum]|uniref:Uridylate kinase n=1 Tax=Synchytrium endobioticum TaxID=286115 RepID=A0A507DHL1_9FUNG|nr:hypothetical protein SeMB42_g05601 [Synchytrium endobioticum]TPX51172.1 hypothetical protein SeLEV6574_g00413 [Synchytrium endobioticum]